MAHAEKTFAATPADRRTRAHDAAVGVCNQEHAIAAQVMGKKVRRLLRQIGAPGFELCRLKRRRQNRISSLGECLLR